MITLLVSLLVLSGCTETEGKKAEEPAKKDEKVQADNSKNKDKEKDKDSIPVEVDKVFTGDIYAYQLYNSTIEAENNVDVYNKVSGIIIALKVEEGDFVKKGQLLAKIEEEDYKLEEASARSAYEKAEREYKRSSKMFKDKLLSENDYEQVKYNYEQAKISWQRAKVRLGYTSIVAPISGTISKRNIKNGDFLQMNTRVFSIVDMNSLITRVYIPEKDISNIKVRQQARVTSDALDGKVFNGRIKMISPVVDPTNGTVKVTIALSGYKNQIKPGMFVKCHIITDSHKDTLLVSKKAVIYNGLQSVVFKVDKGVAHKIVLDLGYQDAEKVEVLNKELKADDKIIVTGQYGLKDKDEVKIINNNKA